MKLKKRFQGILLPFRNNKNQNTYSEEPYEYPGYYNQPRYTWDEYLVFAILVIVGLLVVGINFCCDAQTSKINAVSIGERVPEVTANHVLNYPSPTISLSQYHGKLVILDFWATSCASCINALPRLDSLQQQFGNRIQIITVSYEPKARILYFFKHNPTGRMMRLPVVFQDSKLAAMFPHRMLSHEIWIDGAGVVKAITAAEYVNAANIARILQRQPVDLPVKNDVLAYDYNLPLVHSEEPLYYSLMAPFKPGVVPRFGTIPDSTGRRLRTFVINFPVLKMYMMAVGKFMYFPKTLMDISVKDSALLNIPPGEYRSAWNKHYNFCYEAVFPSSSSPDERLELFRQDLNRFLRLDGHMEHRKARCLALVRTDLANHLMNTKGGTPINNLHYPGNLRYMRNASLDNLIWELNELPKGLPTVDHTGFHGNADIELHLSSFSDLDRLNIELARYGLAFRYETDDLEFFVLHDAR